MQAKIKKLLLAFLTAAVGQSAYAIDLQPGDVIAPKPGINALQLTYQYSEKNDFYSHGNKVAGYPTVSSSVYVVRVGHSFEVGPLPAYFYLQTPFGAVHPKGYSGGSGMGDTSMAFALWPYANRETRTYLGVAAYLVAPTGNYDSSKLVSMGENRYKTALQVGYEMPLSDKISGMTAFDALWHGDNTDAPLPRRHQKLEQDTLYTAQVGARYDFNPQYSLTGTYYYTFGGETSYEGIDQNNSTRLQRFQLSGIGNYSFGRLTLQYSRDLKTENGYFEDGRLTLRYTVRF